MKNVFYLRFGYHLYWSINIDFSLNVC
jgi:hypothetical protein